MDLRTDELFCDLMELPSAERAGALAAIAGLSAESKAVIQRMLADAEQADAYFTGPPAATKMLSDSSRFEREGTMCGPYKLVHKLGEGGFGAVWLAQQEKPLKRKVAVKVIKAGMDTDEVLARFDAEKQALARMDHPNIAKVFDAGMTDHGRPYFVMELVEGKSITRYSQENAVGLRERLRLFMDVCSALSHAHQKGVIHRDIKPSNVIVTGGESGPVAKVIDFGIAKSIEGSLTDHTLHTRVEQWIGTPAYMSPEQAGLGATDVDTRSDIYGLGVLLYELITGDAPFDSATLLKAGYEEMRRIIREVEPEKPSVRIITSGRNAGKSGDEGARSGKAAVKAVATELDWIVLKAMEKSRERRYESAAALSSDVGRYLSDKPIEARPPGKLYLFSKFIRRNRLAITTGSAFILLIVAAAVISIWLALRAMDAEKVAQERLVSALKDRHEKDQALQEAEAVSSLLADVFQRPQPGVDGRNVTVVQALDAALDKLDVQLATQPQRRATLRAVLAETYERLGIFDRSFAIRKEDFELMRELSGIGDRLTRDALRKLIEAAEAKGDSQAALDFASLEIEVNAQHGADPEAIETSLRSRVMGLFGTGERAKAIERQRELVDFCRERFGEESHRLTKALWELRQYESRPAHMQVPSDTDPALNSISNLEIQLAQLTQEHGSTHAETVEARVKLANALGASGHTIEALLHLRSAQPVLLAQHGPQDERTLEVQSLLARVYVKLGFLIEATRIQQAIVHALRERDGGAAPATIDAEDALERRFFYSGPREEYEAFLNDLLRRRTKLFGEDHVQTAWVRLRLVTQRFAGGEDEIQGAIKLLRERYGPRSRGTAEAVAALARKYATQGKTREAMPLFVECGPHMRDDTWLNFELATFQLWMNDTEGYRATRRYMLEYWLDRVAKQKWQAEMFDRAIWLCSLADYDDENQKASIRTLMDYVKTMRQGLHMEADDRHTPTLKGQIYGIVFYRLGDYPQALATLREAERVMGSDTYKPGGLDYQLSRRLIYSFIAMTEQRLGNTAGAERMFDLAASRFHREPPSEENPHVPIFVGGFTMVDWLAHREAKKLLNQK
jgi:serine/threonine protein kinase